MWTKPPTKRNVIIPLVLGGGAVALGTYYLPFGGALSMIGFSSVGVTKGSVAAAIHTYLGNVAAGSFFALLKSTAAIGPSAAALIFFSGIVATTSGSGVVIANK